MPPTGTCASRAQPKLIDRRVREDWASTGATDLYSRARAKAIEILDSHHPEPLPADVAAEIRGIVVGTERELGITA